MQHNSSVFLTVAITMERHHAYCRPTQVGNKEAKVSAFDKKRPKIWDFKFGTPKFEVQNLGLLSVALKLKRQQSIIYVLCSTTWQETVAIKKIKRQQSMIYVLCSTTWRETRGAWARDLPFMFALLFSQPWL